MFEGRRCEVVRRNCDEDVDDDRGRNRDVDGLSNRVYRVRDTLLIIEQELPPLKRDERDASSHDRAERRELRDPVACAPSKFSPTNPATARTEMTGRSGSPAVCDGM